MVFNSLPFLIFLPVVVGLFFLMPHRTRWVLLLVASYFFYGYWKVEYLALIVLSTALDYMAAQLIASTENPTKRLTWLCTSLAANLGLLFFFKYSGWFMNDVLAPAHVVDDSSLARFNEMWQFALPVGISFYTFQSMGYTVDVYFGQTKPERNPLKFALFVSFFPQLVAGPIERFSSLHHQLFEERKPIYTNFLHGGRLMLYGLFVKMCVADNIAPIVDQIFGHHAEASSAQLAWGMVLFGLQIYSDFHGYSLIAIGSARLFDIHLMDNFNRPYSALTVREFWGRWHISLSTWFRDYLFIPLGGSRVGWMRWAVNIMVVFAVSGLWHGANWTFVVWGALHGMAYLLEHFSGFHKLTAHVFKPVRWAFTMAVVFVAWVFFRSDSIATAIGYLMRMASCESTGISVLWDAIIVSLVGLFLVSDVVLKSGNIHVWLNTKPTPVRWGVYALLIYCIMAHSGTVNHPFIYFQF